MTMLSFLNKYKWYRDADKRWHLNELDKQLSSKLDDYKLTLEEKDGKTEELAGESFALKYYLSDETKNLDKKKLLNIS